MKILIIAFSESIHTARWINQIADQNWEIYLYPSQITNKVHADIRNVKILVPKVWRRKDNKYINLLFNLYNKIRNKTNSNYYEKRLYRYIKKFKPNIIHTLETQNAGYLVYDIKKKYFKNKRFPIWWHTNWGSDIYLFGRLKEHKDKIKEVLHECDYYSCECERDVKLAKEIGFSKTIMPVYPNTGGFDLKNLDKMRGGLVKPSKRKIIMLKGYQGWSGRALVAIRALTRIKEYLKEYKILIYTSHEIDVRIAAELLSIEAGIDIQYIPINSKHEEILRHHGNARVSIGLSISDAISTSVLEAMAMGSFPIQSWTSGANEWFEDGKSGLLVPPEDPEIIEEAIKRALTDDELVDRACEINWDTVQERLNYDMLKEITIRSYKHIIQNSF